MTRIKRLQRERYAAQREIGRLELLLDAARAEVSTHAGEAARLRAALREVAQ